METLSAPMIEWSAALRSLREESGDQYLVKPVDDGTLVGVVDGIGHGPEAAAAARTALAALDELADEPVTRILACCHERLRATRGVVMSVARFRLREATMTWAGVGNVDGILVPAAKRQAPERLLLRAGVLGHQLPALDAVSLPVAAGDTLI